MTTSVVTGMQMEDSPVGVAWQAVGRPSTAGAQGVGRCARCGSKSPLVPLDRVVSRGFTSFEEWVANPTDGVCLACAWAYRFAPLRAVAHLTGRAPARLLRLEGPRLRQVLSAPVDASRALAVPRRAGRKHVLVNARWGRVVLDDVVMEWTTADAERIAAMELLRIAGAPARSFTAPAPPWRLVAGLLAPARLAVLEQWRLLDPWRAAPAWLDLALLATGGMR